MKLVILSVLLVALVLESNALKEPSPILFFPGITNSALNAKNSQQGLCNTKGNSERVWIRLLRLVLCGQKEMSLVYDEDTNQFKDSPGVEIEVPSFGGTESVEFTGINQQFPYLMNFLNYFVERGYKRGRNIRTAPYDWRLAADELDRRGYFGNVKELIEEMYRDNNNQSVTLVSHSMGGLVSHHFFTRYPGINQQWKDKHIHAWVTLSGAWSGGVPALAVVLSGRIIDNIPFLDATGISGILAPIFGPISRTLQSVPWIFPRSSIFKNQVLVSTPTKNYTAADYEELFKDVGYEIGYPTYKYLTEKITPNFPSPNVNTHCFYGIGEPTAIEYVYNKDLKPGTTFIQPSETKTGDGDGSVNLVSSEICLPWRKMSRHSFEAKQYKGANHLGMVSDKRVLSEIEKIVTTNQAKRRFRFRL